MFRFKQFVIEDECCAMKVGTDGVLLGAWSELLDHSMEAFVQDSDPLSLKSLCHETGELTRVLDIGTGSGLVAIMLAQRYPNALVVGVEIDKHAAMQAKRNFEKSPFASRLEVELSDIQQYKPDYLFDHIVCNPPFFEEDLVPPDARRARARHTSQGLDFESLISVAAKLLHTKGTLQVIIPASSQQLFLGLATAVGFSLLRRMKVKTVVRKPVRRVLLHFQRDILTCPVVEQSIILMKDGMRSFEYSELCKDFYL